MSYHRKIRGESDTLQSQQIDTEGGDRDQRVWQECHPFVTLSCLAVPVDGIDPCGNVPSPSLGLLTLPRASQASTSSKLSCLTPSQNLWSPQCPLPVQSPPCPPWIPPGRRGSYLFLVTKSIPTASINILGMAEKIDCLISRHRVKL